MTVAAAAAAVAVTASMGDGDCEIFKNYDSLQESSRPGYTAGVVT